ncbi:DoxX family membrane protein [Streptomyces sp. PKU-EA00015]|uniref:DoxX family protein n=1 Tax=Streptomyces sp. PKU-EA00015 TaxID=2748326 RepID=UPI0015A2AF48|nr:DoxX family membrane protein [Streptomyces sp. PKU-EA00015]NWF27436.1 DoxX family membrane protein [Streptomyces sp. PKU-EA00015]
MNSALERSRRRVATVTQALAARYHPFSDLALRISVGVVFAWFGILKFLPGASPAQDIATRCMGVLSFGLVPAEVSRPLLAVMEVGIGLGLITGWLLRTVLAVFFVHMAGVFAALVIAPDVVWAHGSPLLPTLEGQYIIKNIVLVTACLAVASHLGPRRAAPNAAPGPDAAPAADAPLRVLSGAGPAGRPPAS